MSVPGEAIILLATLSLSFLIYNVTVPVPTSQGHWEDSRRLSNMPARGSENAGWICPEHLLNARLCSRCHPESPGMEDVTVPATERLALWLRQ